MSFNNYKQKVNSYLNKFGNTSLAFVEYPTNAQLERLWGLDIKPEFAALGALKRTGFNF